MSKRSMASRALALLVATAIAGVMSIALATPAAAEGERSGYMSCSSQVKVQSNTTGYGPTWFLVYHISSGIDREWSYSGYHGNLTAVNRTSWKAYTNGSMSSGWAICSGIV